jgi:hypothetical protein
MREADRVAANKVAARKAQIAAESRKAEAALRGVYTELADRLDRAVPTALAAQKTRGYEDVVQLHGTVHGWFLATEEPFGALELFSFNEPIPYDDYAKRRVTVYLSSRGDIACGDGESHPHVTVWSADEYRYKLRKELDKVAAILKRTPDFKPWVTTDVNSEADLWTLVGLRKVVEALEHMSEPPSGLSADPSVPC